MATRSNQGSRDRDTSQERTRSTARNDTSQSRGRMDDDRGRDKGIIDTVVDKVEHAVDSAREGIRDSLKKKPGPKKGHS